MTNGDDDVGYVRRAQWDDGRKSEYPPLPRPLPPPPKPPSRPPPKAPPKRP